MNEEIIEYGAFYSYSDVRDIIIGMEKLFDDLGYEEQLKLRDMIHSIQLASEKSGDMVTIMEPSPFQQDFVAIAERLMDENHFDAAKDILNQFITEIPATWKPKLASPKEDFIFFWNRNEFDSYVEYLRKGQPKCTHWVFPSYSKAYYLLAYISIEQGEFEQGKFNLNKGLLLEPDHPKLLTEKGVLLGRMGFEMEAVEFLKRATNSRIWNTKHQKAHSYRELSVALANLNLMTEAENALQKAIAIFPDDSDLKEDLNYLKENK